MAPDPIHSLLSRARQRTIVNLLVEQGSAALSAAFALGIILLILGTQILDWYWPVTIGILAFAIGLARYWRSLPDTYQIAQRVDAGLALPDTLSTAWHFREEQSDVCQAQRAQASSAARAVDTALAIPLNVTRFTHAAAALGVVFLSLMAYRYIREQRLDLSSPLAPGLVDLFGSSHPEAPLAQLRNERFQRPPGSDPLQTGAETQQEEGKDNVTATAETPEDLLKAITTPDVSNEGAESFKGPKGEEIEGEGEEQAGGEKSGGSSQEAGAGEGKEGEKGGQKKDGTGDAPAKEGQGGESSSLLDKMRDALSNLMAKMKQQPKGGDQMAKSGKKEGQGQAGKGQQKKGEGKPEAGQKGDQAGQGEQQGQSDAEAGNQEQAAQGQGQSDSNQPGGDDPKSGMGKADGSKDVKLSREGEALGKLSEIIGKRSEKQTGEVMVEVSSSKAQQLRTGYSQRVGQHADTGGEIHRDGIPQSYQPFIQRYFEEIRRTPPAPAAAKPQ